MTDPAEPIQDPDGRRGRRSSPVLPSETPPGKVACDQEMLASRMHREALAMLAHASSGGHLPAQSAGDQFKLLTMPVSNASELVERSDDVLEAHRQLSAAVAPARPETLLRLQDEARERRQAKGWSKAYRSLGPLPIVRQTLILAALFLIGFVLLTATTVPSISTPAPTTTTTAPNGGK